MKNLNNKSDKNEEGIEKIMPFQVFQAHCCERNFLYAGKPRYFNVECRLGPDRCNQNICPIWNSNRVRDVPSMSLRDINLTLKNDTLNRGDLEWESLKNSCKTRSKRLRNISKMKRKPVNL
jgi:hypothetical protein